MTPYVFTNSSFLTKNDTNNLHYGGAGESVKVDGDKTPAIAPFAGSVVAWSAILNTALPTDDSTLRVRLYVGGSTITGTLGGFTFTTDTARSTYNSTSNLGSYTFSAGGTFSVDAVASNHGLVAANNLAVTIYTV
jgi:hypothetical protein